MRKKAADPLPERPVPFNPLDKMQLGKSVAQAFLGTDSHPLTPLPRFFGAGVYALYYTGNHPLYAKLVKRNSSSEFSIPIYIGKAVPSGGRKGDIELDASVGQELWSRLGHHAKSIRQTANLVDGDFQCRYMVIDDVWIPLGESLLIRRFRPLWNVVVEGFGNNPTGGPRKGQRLSSWDMLHPGRSGVGQATPESRKREELLAQKIDAHMEFLTPL